MGIKIFSPLSYSEGKLYGLSPSTPSATTLDLTFARNSTNRTRVSNRGVVQDVPYNLLSFSEEFDNTAWTKTQSTVTPNAVQPPNNPNYTADLIYPTGSTAFIQTSGTTTTASGGTYYFSVYARAAGKNFIMLNGSGGTTGVWYNLSTGVIGTQSAGNGYILNMGNGWYYCVWFGNLTGALQPIIRISDADNSTSNTASGTNGVFLWGAQLSQSTAVQPYFKTTNRLNVPAIDYSLSTGGSGCLLMEPQRTNLLLNSGTLSTQSVTVSAVQHTLSFYGTGTTALSGAFTGGLTGTTATGRVSLTFTPTAGTLTLTVTGVITNAQLEVGAYPTSYIPTTAASATRLADSFTRNSLFSNNYVTAAGGTWFVDLDNNIALARDAADVGLFLGDTATGTTNSFCINTPSGSSRMEIDSYVNGSATTLHVTTTDRTRAAIKWNGSTADVFVNGSKVVSGTTFTGTTLEYMGLNVRDTPKYTRGMWLAPVPLTDADCITMTKLNTIQLVNWDKQPYTNEDMTSFMSYISSNLTYTQTQTTNTFGNLTGTNKWIGGVLAPNGKIYGIPVDSTTVLEIDPITQTTNTFGNLIGVNKWTGGVLAPNGKIYGIPLSSTSILEIDPITQTITTFGTFIGSIKWHGGVLAPNGKIYGIPRDSTAVLEIDPITRTTNTFGNLTGTTKWFGGVLAPNGKIYGIPADSTTVLEIDPITQTTNTFGNLGAGTSKWNGGVLAPNGKIYGIPRDSTAVLEIDPITRTTNTFGNIIGNTKWLGGVLAPNGKIYGIPRDSTAVLEIDPITRTTNTFGNLTGTNKWIGGVLAPNGKIYGIPHGSTTVLEILSSITDLDINIPLSRHLNKF